MLPYDYRNLGDKRSANPSCVSGMAGCYRVQAKDTREPRCTPVQCITASVSPIELHIKAAMSSLAPRTCKSLQQRSPSPGRFTAHPQRRPYQQMHVLSVNSHNALVLRPPRFAKCLPTYPVHACPGARCNCASKPASQDLAQAARRVTGQATGATALCTPLQLNQAPPSIASLHQRLIGTQPAGSP